MRKRTSPKVVWLPPDGSAPAPAAETSGFGFTTIDISGAVQLNVAEIPLTIDAPPDASISTLADMESSAYRLRRIVGKIWCRAQLDDDESDITDYIVTAGLIVRRVDETGASLAGLIGVEQMAPSEAINWSDPWIWRRSWLLTNPLGVAPDRPTQNYGEDAGSAVDGPHVDQKTARIVSKEERLFLNVSAQALFVGGQSELTHTVSVFTDLRVLATMRTSQGNRRNSSR